VQQVPVDIQNCRAIIFGPNNVGFPEFVVKRLHHDLCSVATACLSDQVIPSHTVIHKDYAIYCTTQNRNRQKRGIGDTKFGYIVRCELEIADIGTLAVCRPHPQASCRTSHGAVRN
jgi:hypothetical protein